MMKKALIGDMKLKEMRKLFLNIITHKHFNKYIKLSAYPRTYLNIEEKRK